MSKRRPYCSVNQQALKQFEIKDRIRLSSRETLHCCSAVLCNEDTQSFYILRVHIMQPPLSRALSIPSFSPHPSTSTLPTNHLIIGLFPTSKNLKNVKFYLHVSKKTSENTLTNRMVDREHFNKNRLTLREREGLGWFPMFDYCGTRSAQ